MSGPTVRLYTPEVLALATGLARWPHDPAMPLQGRARSQSCGSTLAISLQTDADGRLCAIGLGAQACAIGQACASLFAAAALGLTRSEIAEAQAAMDAWLKGDAPMPGWPGLEAVSVARGYPARHGAMLLAWRAALDALP